MVGLGDGGVVATCGGTSAESLGLLASLCSVFSFLCDDFGLAGVVCAGVGWHEAEGSTAADVSAAGMGLDVAADMGDEEQVDDDALLRLPPLNMALTSSQAKDTSSGGVPVRWM